jgi:hypothetical protein
MLSLRIMKLLENKLTLRKCQHNKGCNPRRFNDKLMKSYSWVSVIWFSDKQCSDFKLDGLCMKHSLEQVFSDFVRPRPAPRLSQRNMQLQVLVRCTVTAGAEVTS